ncbi:MAG: hypothetical protein AAF380_01825 [Bacteroidota bacterium]
MKKLQIATYILSLAYLATPNASSAQPASALTHKADMLDYRTIAIPTKKKLMYIAAQIQTCMYNYPEVASERSFQA